MLERRKIYVYCVLQAMASLPGVLSFGLSNEYQRLQPYRNKGRMTTSPWQRSSVLLNTSVKFRNFEQVLDTFHEEAVAILFSTPMCGPCKIMKKEMATVKETVGDRIKLFSVDAEKWPQVGSRFEITRLPCFIVFQEGEVKLRLEGVNSAETLVAEVQRLL